MFESFAAVMMVVLFAVPGMIWRYVEGLISYVDRRQPWEKFALGLVTRSVFVYLPVWPIIWQMWHNKLYESSPWTTGLLGFTWVFVVPVIWGVFFGAAQRSGLIQRVLKKFLGKFEVSTFEHHPVPTAWDSVFSSLPTCWAVVTLKNKDQIRGYLGPDSHVSSDPDDRDIYLSHTLYQDEDGHWGFVNDTKGVYIPGQQIVSVEFIEDRQSHSDNQP